jgi:hypothetical protein
VRVSQEEARTARIGGSSPPVVPDRRNFSSIPDAAPPAPQPPDGVTRRQTTVRRTPAPEPVPFERQRPAMERDPGRPPDPVRIEEMRPAASPPVPPRRQVRRSEPPVTQPAPVPPPPPAPTPTRPQAAPRRSEPAQTPSPRTTENRRRTIEQERQGAGTQPSESRRERR